MLNATWLSLLLLVCLLPFPLLAASPERISVAYSVDSIPFQYTDESGLDIYFVKNEGFPATSLEVLILVRYCTLAVSGGAGKTRGPFSSNTEDGLFPAQEKKKNTQRKRNV